MVLDHLVLDDAHARLLDSHFGKRDALLVGSHRGGEEDRVHLLLRVVGELPLRLTHAGYGLFQLFDVVHDLILFGLFHIGLLFSCFLLF